MMGLASQTLSALPIVQSFGREEYEQDRFAALSLNELELRGVESD